MEKELSKRSAGRSKLSVRRMVTVALLSAMASVLMFFSFSVPFMPSFIKMDFSELPAIIGAFALGPGAGVTVCLVKNLVNLFFTTTAGIGELCNFLLGVCFVLPAGFIYRAHKSRRGAFIGALAGAVSMALLSIVTNYFIIYPIYANFMPMEAILGAYKAIYPGADTLLKALLIFNTPFTFLKGMASVAITFLVYKKLSPILKGREA